MQDEASQASSNDDQRKLIADWQVGDPLPNVENAIIDEKKFSEYAMNPEHVHQTEANKWKIYADSGYGVVDIEARELSAKDVVGQIVAQLGIKEAIFVRSTPHGPRFEVPIAIVGPNQGSFTLRTIWQYDNGSLLPRLITAIGVRE